MRKTLLALAILAVVLAPLSTLADSCNCTAPDSSCSTSINCPAGCYAICSTGGNCSSGCSGSSGPTEEHRTLKVAPNDKTEGRSTVSVSAKDLTSTDLAMIVNQQLRSAITFVPADPAELYSIDVGDMPIGQFIAALAEFGAVKTVDRQAILKDSRVDGGPPAQVSLKLENTTAGQVAAILNQLMGESPRTLEAGDPSEVISVDVQQMDLPTLVAAMRTSSSIRFKSEAP